MESFIELSDPFDFIEFTTVADLETYPGSTIPVDPRIRAEKLLTGGDFDIESMRKAHDGTLWFGDEFGPFLLHTDAEGRLLEAPIPLEGVMSPQNPLLGGRVPTLPASRGFEGMAISPDGKTLYPMLEGALTTDPDQRRLIISEFSERSSAYTGRKWFYRLESTAHAIGDLTAVNKDLFLVIERDNLQGEAAQFKRIYLVNLTETDSRGLPREAGSRRTFCRFGIAGTLAARAPCSGSRSRRSRASSRSANGRLESWTTTTSRSAAPESRASRIPTNSSSSGCPGRWSRTPAATDRGSIPTLIAGTYSFRRSVVGERHHLHRGIGNRAEELVQRRAAPEQLPIGNARSARR